MKAPPDRLCAEKGSRWFNRDLCERVGVAIDGVELGETVVEYCASTGWARCYVWLADGRHAPGPLGGWRIKRVQGVIAVWWKSQGRPVGIAPPVPRGAAAQAEGGQ
jgi:hypothetical protein